MLPSDSLSWDVLPAIQDVLIRYAYIISFYYDKFIVNFSVMTTVAA